MKKRTYALTDDALERVAEYAKWRGIGASTAVEELLRLSLKSLKDGPEDAKHLKVNLKRSYKLLDTIIDAIEESGYRHR